MNYYIILFLIPFIGFSQLKSEVIFDKYESQDSITSIIVTKHMFTLADSFITDIVEKDNSLIPIQEILSNMESMKILLYEGSNKESSFNKELKQSIFDNYLSIDTTKNKDITFLIDKNSDIINEIVLISDNYYLFLEGNLTMKDVNNVITKFE